MEDSVNEAYRIRTLADWDIELGVKQAGGTKKWTLTNMQFDPNFEQAFEQNKITYVPFKLMSKDDTAFEIDES